MEKKSFLFLKKTNALVIKLIIYTVIFFYAPSHIFSQSCNYLVVNANSSCSIDVEIYWYDYTSGGVSNYCDLQSQTIFANSNWSTNCSGCGPLAEIVVKLVKVGTNFPTGVGFVDGGTFYTNIDSGNAGGCGTYNMSWSGSSCNITP